MYTCISISVLQILPFLEYKLHGRLLNKLRVKGMNAIFQLRMLVNIEDLPSLYGWSITLVFTTSAGVPSNADVSPEQALQCMCACDTNR